ncbi:helix-turn-helix domain-containing protein [Gulosibacter chungangensis]|uniref:helix-turn-helix domain-containing protein n=1 Tax=Gulosibacter chungangensis TaxID=979746 RepID=UPI001787800F|nr:helix-turn-helix domain-containing protein [Gulosibacter chungangensis]
MTDYRGLTEMSRLRLLHAVQRRPGRLLKDLAADAGIHINTARDHMRVLEDEGLVSSAPIETGRRGRPPVVYSPVRDVDDSAEASRRVQDATARGDLLRRVQPDLRGTLDPVGLHQLDTLYEHLDDVGLEPEVNHRTLTVGLKPCRYEPLIHEERPVVCAVHAKLVRDQLQHVEGPLELRRLHPYVGPERCEIVLGIAGEASRASRPGGVSSEAADAELAEQADAALREWQQKSSRVFTTGPSGAKLAS